MGVNRKRKRLTPEQFKDRLSIQSLVTHGLKQKKQHKKIMDDKRKKEWSDWENDYDRIDKQIKKRLNSRPEDDW